MLEFRAWDKENREMVKVELLGKEVLLYKGGEWENIESFEVMQYTGLRDKNCRKIYGGDLLRHPNGTIAEIKYLNDLAAFVAIYKQNGSTEVDYLDKEIVSRCKIIGNIYENPELLEGEEWNNTQTHKLQK